MRHTEKNMIEILKHFYLTETYFMKEMEILEQEEEGTYDKWYEEFYNALTSAREVAKKVFSEAMENLDKGEGQQYRLFPFSIQPQKTIVILLPLKPRLSSLQGSLQGSGSPCPLLPCGSPAYGRSSPHKPYGNPHRSQGQG